MDMKKIKETALRDKAEKILRPIQDWVDASAHLRKRCSRAPKRWKQSNEREYWHRCNLCGRTVMDPEPECWPLLMDRMFRLPPRKTKKR